MKKFIKSMALGAILSMTVFTTAFASDETYLEQDKANNLFSAGMKCEMTGNALDACGAGYDIKLKDATIDGTSALAGYNVDVNNSTIGGTLFAAGYNIDVNNSEIENNIIATGCFVNVGSDVKLKNITASAQTVYFGGEAEYACLSGEKVFINGTIIDDITIKADEVVIGNDAQILGDLNVEASQEPENVVGHVDGEYNFEQRIVEETSEDVAAANNEGSGFDVFGAIRNRLYWIAAMLILGVAMLFMMDGEINSSKSTLVSKPAVMLGLGFAMLAGVPLACILLAVTVIGLPSAGILLTLYILALCISQTFTGLSVGRLVLSKFIKNEKLASLAGVAILVVVDAIPWVGGIVSFVAMLFTLGYIILRVFNQNIDTQPDVVDITNETAIEVVSSDVVSADVTE